MNGYAIQTRDKLKHVIVGFRKSAGLIQEDLAVRLGVAQQTYSTSERNAANMSVTKLLSVLHALGVELVLQPKSAPRSSADSGVTTAQW